MNRNIFLLFLTLGLVVLTNTDMQAQCAMCKAAAETSMKGDAKSMARSLNAGILYLMAVPYLAVIFIFRKQIAQLLRSKFGRTAKH